MSLTDAEVRRIAYLARLELSDDEVAMVRPQLDRILEFIESLSALDTENVEPMTTALDVDNRWRGDLLVSGLSNAQALGNAPAHDEECFLVPAVLGTTAARK